uniref:Glucokinase regulator n=1 Tax=Fundulus heteroclitus TaxID=8078 RepID=A0A3Q2QWZ2_FUNHE
MPGTWQLFVNYEPDLPVSEMSNPLTRDIDRAPARGIVKMLQACDAQMFQDESGAAYERLLSDRVVKSLMEVAERVQLILKDPQDGLIVLSGCGTSGRLAFLSRFNRKLRQLNRAAVCSYIIAGGDRSLLSSQEAPEDDPMLGALSLKKVSGGKKRVLFIGISCGLSAPFVAGQLDFCLQHPDVYTPVLVGFNPAHQARNEAIPGCTLTFRSVVARMQDLAKMQKAFLINPVLGPEAISGSSRMKGGSATKILLEAVFSAAHAAHFSRTPITYKYLIVCFSLQCGGRVCYLSWGFLGLLGLIDASECKPTFGAGKIMNTPFSVLCLQDPEFGVAHDDFLNGVLPRLTDKDTVLLLYSHDVDGMAELARRVREKTSNMHAVYHQTDGDAAAQQVSVYLSSLSTRVPSDGGHADLQPEHAYTRCWKGREGTAVPQIRSARDNSDVVPLALVCLLTGCSIKEAKSRLEQKPVVREAVEACLLEQQASSLGSL